MSDLLLAHGVGRVYESPIPFAYYLAGAALTVVVSFVIRAVSKGDKPLPDQRRVAGPRLASILSGALRWGSLLFLVLAIVAGVVVREVGFTFTTLMFWVGLIVGVTALSGLIAGAWETMDPWATLDRLYRIEPAGAAKATVSPPWWVGPLLLYALFWFELVSGVGFDDTWIIFVLIAYSIFSLGARSVLGESWERVDPLQILFGFAARLAPFRLASDGIYRKGSLRDLDPGQPMPLALYGSLFVLLASTTLDNVIETVGWNDLLRTLHLSDVSNLIVDTVALGLFTLPFLLTFLGAVAMAHRWIGRDRALPDVARSFGWSLIPIGVAYVLAHNAPLLITGVPELIRSLSDPFQLDWNLLGTASLWQGFLPSPRFVWFLEIAIIVGGHILGVLAAHRTAVRLSDSHSAAVRSQYALTVLMSIYTIATLWLLGQPLVT